MDTYGNTLFSFNSGTFSFCISSEISCNHNWADVLGMKMVMKKLNQGQFVGLCKIMKEPHWLKDYHN